MKPTQFVVGEKSQSHTQKGAAAKPLLVISQSGY